MSNLATRGKGVCLIEVLEEPQLLDGRQHHASEAIRTSSATSVLHRKHIPFCFVLASAMLVRWLCRLRKQSYRNALRFCDQL